jgi:hypothetical protein
VISLVDPAGLIEDAYVAFLGLPADHPVRLHNQSLLSRLRDYTARSLGQDPEFCQRYCEERANYYKAMRGWTP